MDSLSAAPARSPSMLLHLLAMDRDDERHRLVHELMDLLDFDWLAWGPVRRGAQGTELLDAWDAVGAQDWQRRYRALGYQRLDPRMDAALDSRLPVVWQLEGLRRAAAPAQRRFVEDLAGTGMRSGVMLALGGAQADERTVVCLLSRERGEGLADDDTRIGQVVTLGLCLRELQQQARSAAPPAPPPAPMPLNRTQQAILQYLACGLCDKQIAGRLALSLHTVDYHMRQLRKRYGARNRVQLIQNSRPGDLSDTPDASGPKVDSGPE